MGKSDVVIVYLIRPQAVTAGDRNRVENGDITVGRKMSVFIAQNSRVVIAIKTCIFFGNSQYGSPFHAAEIVFFSEITYAEMGGNIVGSIRRIGMAVGRCIEDVVFGVINQISIIHKIAIAIQVIES